MLSFMLQLSRICSIPPGPSNRPSNRSLYAQKDQRNIKNQDYYHLSTQGAL